MNDLSYDSKEYMGFDFPEPIFDFPELIKESNSYPLKPDQKFDRFQIPWNDLEKIIKDCLFFTPFNGVKLWQ